MERWKFITLLCVTLCATGARAAEISRTADTDRAGAFSLYGLYNFDYTRMPSGIYSRACAAQVEPGVMYTVSDRLAIGAALQSGFDSHAAGLTEQSRLSLGLAPRIRYQMALGDNLTLIPEITVSYLSAWQSDSTDRLPASNSQLWATLYLPLLIRPTPLSQGDFRPVLQWDVKSTVHFNNGSGPLGVFTPGSHNEADITCQSTLGIHF